MSYISPYIDDEFEPRVKLNKYQFSLTQDPLEIAQAQAFRGQIFRNGEIDRDELDDRAFHGIIRNQKHQIVCVFRILRLTPENIDQSYSAQFYDLGQLKKSKGASLELGRFCVHPDHHDADIIRLAWAELTKFVFANNIDILFGCSSFHGADARIHEEALTLLKERHLAPIRLMPKIKAPKVFQYAKALNGRRANLQLAQKTMPPLLRSYLSMGGWVSDHAVLDEDLDTVHVFTGVQISAIPNSRRRQFLSLASRIA